MKIKKYQLKPIRIINNNNNQIKNKNKHKRLKMYKKIIKLNNKKQNRKFRKKM